MTVRDYLQTRYLEGLDTHSGRERLKGWLTSALVPYERKRASALEETHHPLKLHIGCGDTYLNGWVNIDLARPRRMLDLRWDLRRGLPFSDLSTAAIFSEHFFEHLNLNSAFHLMTECHRVLAPEGIFRIAVPDLERYINAYHGNDSIIEEKRKQSPTMAIALNEIVYFHGHRSMYDAETLSRMLQEAGFSVVERSAFREGALLPSPDNANRRAESLYIEATS